MHHRQRNMYPINAPLRGRARVTLVAECQQYLASLPIPDKVCRAMPLLFKELTEEVVHAALERMKRGSAPGMDSIPAELYQA